MLYQLGWLTLLTAYKMRRRATRAVCIYWAQPMVWCQLPGCLPGVLCMYWAAMYLQSSRPRVEIVKIQKLTQGRGAYCKCMCAFASGACTRLEENKPLRSQASVCLLGKLSQGNIQWEKKVCVNRFVCKAEPSKVCLSVHSRTHPTKQTCKQTLWK